MGHSSESELLEKLSQVNVRPGELYYHNSDPTKHYKILNIALEESSESPQVIYQALYGERLVWARNYNNWIAQVIVNGKNIARFTKI